MSACMLMLLHMLRCFVLVFTFKLKWRMLILPTETKAAVVNRVNFHSQIQQPIEFLKIFPQHRSKPISS